MTYRRKSLYRARRSKAPERRRKPGKSKRHDEVPGEDMSWLWPDRAPVGEITLFAGKTGAGKTVFVTDVIARVTKGAPWPDGAGSAPVGEALVFCEDRIASVQNPRLLAAGGDLAKVRHWPATSDFYLDDHLKDLKADLKAHPETRLVVFDPLDDYVIAHSYRNIRAVLGKLLVMVREQGVAVIGVGHPPKGTPASIDSFGGSRGIISRARSFWLVTRDDEDQRLLLWVKCQLTHLRTGLAFEVVGDRVDGFTDQPPRVVWIDGPVEMTADDWWALEQLRIKEAGKRAKQRRTQEDERAITLLSELIITPGKPVRVTEIEKVARERNILVGRFDHCRALQRAADQLGIERNGKWAPPEGGPGGDVVESASAVPR